jgi:tetratricopeptide (TPR) repeat protein
MDLFDALLGLLGIDPGVQKARSKKWEGDLDGAIRSVQELIKAKVPTAKGQNFLAWFLVKKGQPEEALRYADQSIEREPGNTEWQATRARTLRRLGRNDEVLALMQQRYAKNKMDIFNSSELCELLVDMGRTSEALPIYRDMETRFGAEAGTPLAYKIGMTQAYQNATASLRQSGVI